MSQNELYHHGVLGMKWGKRKANYNTGSSSVRSRMLAGAYAATGNKHVGKALDRSNARDANKVEKKNRKKANLHIDAAEYAKLKIADNPNNSKSVTEYSKMYSSNIEKAKDYMSKLNPSLTVAAVTHKRATLEYNDYGTFATSRDAYYNGVKLYDRNKLNKATAKAQKKVDKAHAKYTKAMSKYNDKNNKTVKRASSKEDRVLDRYKYEYDKTYDTANNRIRLKRRTF